MKIKTLIQIAAILAALAISSGNLPIILNEVRIAQLHLLEELQASNWGETMLIPE
jgi:hypothetical protein